MIGLKELVKLDAEFVELGTLLKAFKFLFLLRKHPLGLLQIGQLALFQLAHLFFEAVFRLLGLRLHLEHALDFLVNVALFRVVLVHFNSTRK